MIAEVSALFGVLKGGVELAKTFGDERIDVVVRMKQLLLTEDASTAGAALAFLSITNRSAEPQSVTDIVVDFGTARATRVPISKIDSPLMSGTFIDVQSYVHHAGFEQQEGYFYDFRTLPQDIYLLPNESKSGCVLLMLPEVSEPDHALLIVEVAGSKVLSKEIAAPQCRSRAVPLHFGPA